MFNCNIHLTGLLLIVLLSYSVGCYDFADSGEQYDKNNPPRAYSQREPVPPKASKVDEVEKKKQVLENVNKIKKQLEYLGSVVTDVAGKNSKSAKEFFRDKKLILAKCNKLIEVVYDYTVKGPKKRSLLGIVAFINGIATVVQTIDIIKNVVTKWYDEYTNQHAQYASDISDNWAPNKNKPSSSPERGKQSGAAIKRILIQWRDIKRKILIWLDDMIAGKPLTSFSK